MREQQQAGGLREQRGRLGLRHGRIDAERQQPVAHRLQRLLQAGVELRVEGRRQAARLQAVRQVEAEVEVARAVEIEVEEGLCLGAHVRLRRAPVPAAGSRYGRHRRRGDEIVQPVERLAEQRGVDRLLAVEIAVERARAVAGAAGDLAQAGAFEAEFEEGRAGGVEHCGAPHRGRSLLARDARLAGRLTGRRRCDSGRRRQRLGVDRDSVFRHCASVVST